MDYNPRITGLPAYVVFPEQSRNDSSDIDFVGRFSVSNIGIKFNDKWYNTLKQEKNRSCILGLDKFGLIVYKSPFSINDSIGLANYILSNQAMNEMPSASTTIYKDSLEFTLESALARMVISNRFTGKKLATIKSNGFDLSLIKNKLHGDEKIKFEKYGEKINKGITAFVARYESFGLLNDSSILLCYGYHNTPDSITKNITDEYAMLEYTLNGKFKNIHLIDIPSNMVIYLPDFIIDRDNLYFPFWTLKEDHTSEPVNWANTKYIVHLTRKKENYVMDSVVNYNIPKFYCDKKMYNYLNVDYSSYPYFTSYLGNEIYDNKTNKIINIVSEVKSVNEQIGDDYDQSNELFKCYGINYSATNKKLYCIFKNNEQLLLNIYSPSLSLLSSTNINYKFLPNTSVVWANLYSNVNLLKISLKTNTEEYKQYFLPLDLL